MLMERGNKENIGIKGNRNQWKQVMEWKQMNLSRRGEKVWIEERKETDEERRHVKMKKMTQNGGKRGITRKKSGQEGNNGKKI